MNERVIDTLNVQVRTKKDWVKRVHVHVPSSEYYFLSPPRASSSALF